MSASEFSGIDGLKGIEPVGAVLSVGKKGPSGAPVQKDVFHLLEPHPDSRDRRHPHPLFGPFTSAKDEYRKTVTLQLVHQTRDECFQHHLKMFKNPNGPNHPQKVPACVGNGTRSRRFFGMNGEEADFRDGPCLNSKCEFRIGNKPACKPWFRLLARIIWRDSNMPTMLVKLQSASWYSTKAALGFFDHIDAAARMVGLKSYSLGGFTFTATVSERTSPQKKRRYPVLVFSPLTDATSWCLAQVDRYERIGKIMPSEAVASLTDQSGEGSTTIDVQDYLAHMPGQLRGDQ